MPASLAETSEQKQISAGYYYHISNTLLTVKINSIDFSWAVADGKKIDVFLLTEDQYNDWGGSSSLPSSALELWEDTSSGYFSHNINSMGEYYIVMSNIQGSETVTVQYSFSFNYENAFPPIIPGFEIIFVMVALAGMAVFYVMKRKNSCKIKNEIHGRIEK